MANVNAYIQTFAGGEFGDAMSARVAIDAYQASCELMENWFIQAQGPMVRRPGTDYVGSFDDSSLRGVLKRFEFDVGQNYLLLLTDGRIDFYLNEGRLSARQISASIANGTFSNFTNWTDNSDSGSSAFAASGYLNLLCNGPASAVARTTFSIVEPNTPHVLVFDVENGPVNLRIGSSAGASDYLNTRELRRGHHRLEFTPGTGTCHIQFWWRGTETIKLVDNVSLLPGPNFFIPAPWAEDDLRGVYTSQDGDRLWMFHRDYPPRVLERRDHRAWSLIYFEPDDGPFEPGSTDIKLTPSGRIGQISLTSSAALFTSDDLRRLFRVTHPGQYKRRVANGDGIYSDHLKVTGIGADRVFTANLSGTFTGTITLERSSGSPNDFNRVLDFTSTFSQTLNDSYKTADTGKGGSSDVLYNASNDTSDNPKGRFDNNTTYYRFSINAGNWTSGTVTMELSSNGGSQIGVARVTAFQSETEVDAEVISYFGKAGASELWDQGTWTMENEFPDVTTFAHGRLWTFRRRQAWSSVADDYFSFKDGTEADLSVQFTLRSKSAEGVRWARELDFLCVGTRNEEYIIRSTSLSEPVGPTTTEPSLQGEEGSAGIEAEIGGDSIIYTHRNRRRVMQFAHNPRALSEDSFVSVDLNRLNPEACEAGIVNTVISQEPDRRIFTTLKNGVVKPALFRREEEIMGWGTMTTQGQFEDACVLREADEDVVYFIVRRNINGTLVRMIERLRAEILLNDEDRVHLDSMLESRIDRPDAGITPSALTGSITVTATDDVFGYGGNDQYTKVLLHFDDEDGTTTFEDDNFGGDPHYWTAAGNAHIDTAQSKFGGSSLALDGTGDYISTPDHADFELGSSDFTIDCWFNCTATTGSFELIGGQREEGVSTNSSFELLRLNSDVIFASAFVGSTQFAVTGTTQFTDAANTGWHHLAFVRTGGTLKLFIDGVQEGGDVAISGTVNNSTADFRVGSFSSGSNPWTGWIDEFRLSVGVARWTEDFTPPTVAYSEQGGPGSILWVDGGRVTVTGVTNATQLTGTVTYPLLGKENILTGTREPYLVAPDFWGLATQVTTVTELDHLEGETVHIWADAAYAGTAVVAGGAVTLPYAASRVFVGLGYNSLWKSLKPAYGAQKGTAVNQKKAMIAMGLVLSRTSDCLYLGDTPGKLKPLICQTQPSVLGGASRLFSGEAYEKFNGTFDRDPRIIIAAVGPGPATVKALIPNIQVNE